MSSLDDVILSDAELRRVTGYTQPAKVLAELHRQGFHRARRGPNGIILERKHFEAVCTGHTAASAPATRPRLRAV